MKLIVILFLCIVLFIIIYNYNDQNIYNDNNKKLLGIDKIYIINLKGSKRKEHIINEFKKIGIDNYEFIHPINFLIDDINFDDLKYIISDMNEIDDNLKKNNKYRLGTLSLSIITYYLFYKAKEMNQTFLILEDNIEFNNEFVNKYNNFYKNLPDNKWDVLDLHTTDLQDKSLCLQYFKELKNIYPNMYFNILNSRPNLNEYVLLGCNEGGGAKAYVINSNSYKKIPKLPIKYPADGIKNWLSSPWMKGISYIPNKKLIKISSKFKSDRQSIDNLEHNNHIKLNKENIDNIINTLKKYIK